MRRPVGAAQAPSVRGVALLKLLHVHWDHLGTRNLLAAAIRLGFRPYFTVDDVREFAKWVCVVCAMALCKRRAFHSVPADATLPHPGKVWSIDSL